MKTNEDHHAASFGQLLRHDLAEPWVWLKPLTVALLTWLLGQSGYVGVFALIGLCVLVAYITGDLVRRTPWCGDTAFWRTRPISRVKLFAVKTVAFTILCVIPALLVALVGLSDLDDSVSTAIMCLGVAGLIVLTASSAAAAAIGSLGRGWQVLGWQAVFGAPLLSVILLGVVREVFRILLGVVGLVPGMMLGLGLAALGAVAAWALVGLWGRAKTAGVVLLVTGLAWPWVAGTSRIDFFREPSLSEVELTVEKGPSFLRIPIRLEPMEEDEWFVPSLINVESQNGKGFLSKPRSFPAFAFSRTHDGALHVFSEGHKDFLSVMDVEALWAIPRSSLPKHLNWVPTESAAKPNPATFDLPDPDVVGAPNDRIHMQGSRYRFVAAVPVRLNPKMMPISVQDGLKIMGAGASFPSYIDVNVRMTCSARDVKRSGHFWRSHDPPGIWGILFHESSHTAYGTASKVVSKRPDGLRRIFLREVDFLLRFELPRMESALRGVDPRKVLSESVLYLFEVENLGPATAE